MTATVNLDANATAAVDRNRAEKIDPNMSGFWELLLII